MLVVLLVLMEWSDFAPVDRTVCTVESTWSVGLLAVLFVTRKWFKFSNAARNLMGITLENVKFFRGTVTDVQNLYKAWGDKEKMKEFLNDKAKQKFDDKLGFNITKYLDYLVTNDPDKLKSEPTFADGFEAAMKMYFGE